MTRDKVVPLDWIDASILVYLVFGAVLFATTHFHIWFSAPIALVSMISVGLAVRDRRPSRLTKWMAAAAISVGVAIAFLTGAIGYAYPAHDWIKHFAVFNALRDCALPPQFGSDVMRYYGGFYIASALAGRLVSPQMAPVMLWIWVALGIALALAKIAISSRSIAATLVVVLFAGLDVPGAFASSASIGWGFHGVEWWAGPINYPSIMYGLLWAPQHGLTALLIAALFTDDDTRARLAPYSGTLVGSIALWSPFVALGAMFLLLVLVDLKSIRAYLSATNIGAAIAFTPALALFFLTSAEDPPRSLIWNYVAVQGEDLMRVALFSWKRYISFLIAEIAAPAFAIAYVSRTLAPTATKIAIALAIISCVRLGLENDWAMRVSAPCLAAFAIFFARAFVDSSSQAARWIAPIYLILACASPLAEIHRAFTVDFGVLSPNRMGSASRIGITRVIDAEYPEKGSFVRAQLLRQADARLFSTPRTFCDLDNPLNPIPKQGLISVASIVGANNREWGNGRWWLWAGKSTQLKLRVNGVKSDDATLRFWAGTPRDQTISVSIENQDGRIETHTVALKKAAGEHVELHLRGHPKQFVAVNIETTDTPQPISQTDPRLASFLIRDLEFELH